MQPKTHHCTYSFHVQQQIAYSSRTKGAYARYTHHKTIKTPPISRRNRVVQNLLTCSNRNNRLNFCLSLLRWRWCTICNSTLSTYALSWPSLLPPIPVLDLLRCQWWPMTVGPPPNDHFAQYCSTYHIVHLLLLSIITK